tara:strand:+ start:985 stop:2211 length:1227 start_codon:yes stop_codon:yes gene_type:complete
LKKFNILLIHSLPPKKFRFKGVEDVELLFKNFCSSSNVVEHNFFVKPTEKMKKFDFDAIVFASTFFDRFIELKNYKWLIKQYSFIKNKNSFKIGLPQDDYWCQETRDEWYSENLDMIVSVFDKKQWQILYPKSIENNLKIIRGHTIYLTQENFKKLEFISFEKRKYDIVYRTVGYPFFPNKFGMMKSQIGEIFYKKHKNNFNLNVSNKEKDLIFGDKWISFLSNSKSVLGSNSGSSVIVRNHKHMQELLAYKKKYAKYELGAFENDFFKKNDRGYELSDISPRNIEAAITQTLQVLINGEYGGILKKGKDYFSLNEDLSNTEELIQLLNDSKKIEKITKSCYKTIKNSKTLNSDILIKKIEKHIAEFVKKKDKRSLTVYKKSIKENFQLYLFTVKFYLKYYVKKALLK